MAASSQPFGNLIASGAQSFTGGLNKNWNTAFKTPLDLTTGFQTLPVRPETAPGVANSLFNPADLDVIRGETDPTIRGLMLMEMTKRRTAEEDRKNFPGALKDLYDLQYEARLKARPLEAEERKYLRDEEIAMKFLDTLTQIPQNIMTAGRITQDMYAPSQVGNVQLVNYGSNSARRLF
jgi:hypothetical protein